MKFPEWRIPFSTLVILANFLSILLLSLEVWDFFSRRIYNLSLLQSSGTAGDAWRNAQNLSLTAFLAVYAVVLLVIGIMKRWRAVRLGGLALLAVPIIKVFVYDVFTLQRVYRIAAFVGLSPDSAAISTSVIAKKSRVFSQNKHPTKSMFHAGRE